MQGSEGSSELITVYEANAGLTIFANGGCLHLTIDEAEQLAQRLQSVLADIRLKRQAQMVAEILGERISEACRMEGKEKAT
ncbi:MAG: hypothetical protein EBR82_26415 [Caulobacteraceae bacterium]|nr:hypothetical protein [Caulobacteraceae bacterium]